MADRLLRLPRFLTREGRRQQRIEEARRSVSKSHTPGHPVRFGQWVQDQHPHVLQSIRDSKQN
jgi:hypothetical protein